MEKMILVLVTIARKLLPYFQKHLIIILTEFPLKNLLRKADLSNQVSQWAVKLANFDIRFEPRTAIKAQVLADFIAEFTTGNRDEEALIRPTYDMLEQSEARKTWLLFSGDVWRLHVDGASNSNGAGTGVVLVSPCGILHERAQSRSTFRLHTTKPNMKPFWLGSVLPPVCQVEDLHSFCDSQLIVNQVKGEYEARDPKMLKYQATALVIDATLQGVPH